MGTDCMKKIIIALTLLALLVIPNYSSGTVFAPELFGSGTEYRATVRETSVGIIIAWGNWVSFKKSGQGVIIPLGKTIPDAKIIYFERFDIDNMRFRGFIYFRGHERKFCGANAVENLPANCFEKNEVYDG
jgi:hypothetical protein